MPVTLSSNVNNATCLITVHTARKHSPEFDKQVHQTWIKGPLTWQTNKPLWHMKENVRQAKHMVDIICTWTWICPWRIFPGGQICNDELPSKNSKNADFGCIMKVFFDKRNYCMLRAWCYFYSGGLQFTDKCVTNVVLSINTGERGLLSPKGVALNHGEREPKLDSLAWV